MKDDAHKVKNSLQAITVYKYPLLQIYAVDGATHQLDPAPLCDHVLV